MTGILSPLLLLLTSCCLPTTAVRVKQSALAELHDKLLTDNLLVRPVRNPNDAVVVSLDFHLFQIKELNSVQQTLSVAGFIAASWYDPFMTWNETENEVKRIQVSTDDIWTPEFAIYNSADGEFKDPDWLDSKPIIHSDGYVRWSPQIMFTISCHIDILYFPFDRQQCQISFNNWQEFSTEVRLINSTSEANTNYFIPNSEWNLQRTSAENKIRRHSKIPDSSVVIITLYLERRSMGYVYTMIIPLGFVSIMALLVFPLTSESGEKISLGVTMLLTFSVFQLLISDSLPKSSKNVPYIMLYVVALMAMNAASVMLTVLVLHFHHKDPAPRLPKWARKFIFNFLGAITCAGSESDDNHEFTNFEEWMEQEDWKYSESTRSRLNSSEFGYFILKTLKELQMITRKMKADEEDEAIKGEWKKAGAILDRFFFIFGSAIWLGGTILVMYILINQKV